MSGVMIYGMSTFLTTEIDPYTPTNEAQDEQPYSPQIFQAAPAHAVLCS